jgi:hypothetical protein
MKPGKIRCDGKDEVSGENTIYAGYKMRIGKGQIPFA